MAVVVVLLQCVVMMLLHVLIHRVLLFRRHVLWHQDGRELDCT
jgi:hypothetical protein